MRSISTHEYDDTQRHGYPPTYAQRPPQWNAGAQYYQHYEGSGHETVINGTTWYQQERPGERYGGSNFSVTHQPMAARYGNINPVNSVGLEGRSRTESARSSHSRHHRQPHAVAHGTMPHPPYAHGPVRGHPVIPYCDRPSGVMPSYPYDDGPHDTMPYDEGPHRVMPSYPYVGPGRAHGVVSSYFYDGPGRAHGAVPSPSRAHGAVPSPSRAHGIGPSPARAHGRSARKQASREAHVHANSFHASLGAPPHAIQTLGQTTRQVVEWCGMTMPVIVTSQAAAVIEWIQRQSGDLFGFDIEWKPNRLKGEDNKVALLQLCGPNDCLIVQLLYTDMIPNTLKEFLLNPKKWLGGVGIRQDVNKLESDHGLACQGQMELGTLASEKLQRSDLQGRGLKKLVDQVLGMALVKIKKITMSNWEKEYLDEKQIEYACLDAWAAFAILQKLTVQ